jgi:hypothetical protein
MKNYLLVLVMLITGIDFVYGQDIRISFPVTRIVFQRNQANRANFNIAGNYYRHLEQIDAKAIPMQPGQGSETNWQTIATHDAGNLTYGYFQGNFDCPAGWYRILLRGWSGGNIVTFSEIERIGVGEVFVVAGQSNAEGSFSYEGAGIGARDDRVSCINYRRFENGDAIVNEDDLPFSFSQLGDNHQVGPYNPVPWVWSRLGDILTQRLNVPVLFYGAALGGTDIGLWKRSANGEDLRRERPIFVKFAGSPYKTLQLTLQHYASRTGMRAVLWHQGEADINNSAANYANDLTQVINQSRNDYGTGALAWMVARVSIPNGQNSVINNVPHVFAGPNTDVINTIPETNAFRDNGHFAREGINWAARLWNESLTNNFFNSSQPQSPAQLIPLRIRCDVNRGRDQFIVEPINNYSQYRWNTGNTARTINTGPGQYTLRVKDGGGRPFFSPEVGFFDDRVVYRPVISNLGQNDFCEGISTSIREVNGQWVEWNDGRNSNTIDVARSGEFFAIKQNTFGCRAESNRISINVKPKPTARITASSNEICRGDSASLTAQQAQNYIWNNGSRNQRINVKNSGSYKLVVQAQNGCIDSTSVSIKVNELPKANIFPDGEIRSCPETPASLESSQPNLQNIWNTGSSSARITPNQNGVYTLRVKDQNGCISLPDTSKFQFFVSPTATIQADGLTSICDGKSVDIFSKDDFESYRWSNGSTAKRINVKQQGKFTLQVRDNNGCLSNIANVDISVKSNPKIPSIKQNGIYQLEGSTIDNPQIFEWRLENQPLKTTTSTFKALKTGFYDVRAGFNYPVGNQTLTCFSDYSSAFSFILDPSLGLVIYPNPTNDGLLSVEVKEDLKNVNIALYDLKGNKIYEGTMPDLTEKRTLNLKEMPKGYYVLKIFDNAYYVQHRKILLDY